MALKILSDKQIRELDAYTIQNEPIPSHKLMWRAAKEFTVEFIKQYPSRLKPVHVLCGMGNNGGDGLCISIMLKEQGYQVNTYAVRYTQEGSRDFQLYAKELTEYGIQLQEIENEKDIPSFLNHEIIIEGLWGTGLSRAIEGIGKAVIKAINDSPATIVSIDIPSGLNTDCSNDYVKVKADQTISFQLPKLCFFLPGTGNFCGKVSWVDIGLSSEKIKLTDCSRFLLEESDVVNLLPKRERFSHKGSYGRALVIGGSTGLAGAVAFASTATHYVETGLVSAAVPKNLVSTLQSLCPETMIIANEGESAIHSIPEKIDQFDAIAFGPGIGKDSAPEKALEELLKQKPKKLLIDADGLNILARNKELLRQLPEGCILTPHVGEFDRLAGESADGFERIEKLKQFAIEWKVWIVLKDSYTAIASPSGLIYINPTGNPLLAHGGSGDVLCGTITGLLARGLSAEEACKLGVYLHGLAADLYSAKTGSDILMPLDLCKWLAYAQRQLNQTRYYG